VIGVNIFPYWSPNVISERTGCNGKSIALCTQSTAQNVLDAVKKASGTIVSAIVTEEGWPSCYSTSSQHPTDASLENDYFTNWLKHENQVFDSYYFMAYDLGKSVCPPQNGADANNYFGLCDANGASKAGLSISCPHGSLTAPRRVR
jgi:exo-beta-1,3-glucanase (GH17 family)